ncbi:uncharacterized protein A4U43_C08F6530 [Asparagus officinalis]|nr:uncharacterized protein A4U43_C08F6530 [Asparagus officinalis]
MLPYRRPRKREPLRPHSLRPDSSGPRSRQGHRGQRSGMPQATRRTLEPERSTTGRGEEEMGWSVVVGQEWVSGTKFIELSSRAVCLFLMAYEFAGFFDGLFSIRCYNQLVADGCWDHAGHIFNVDSTPMVRKL